MSSNIFNGVNRSLSHTSAQSPGFGFFYNAAEFPVEIMGCWMRWSCSDHSRFMSLQRVSMSLSSPGSFLALSTSGMGISWQSPGELGSNECLE